MMGVDDRNFSKRNNMTNLSYIVGGGWGGGGGEEMEKKIEKK